MRRVLGRGDLAIDAEAQPARHPGSAILELEDLHPLIGDAHAESGHRIVEDQNVSPPRWANQQVDFRLPELHAGHSAGRWAEHLGTPRNTSGVPPPRGREHRKSLE
jgi:hypothetical protein